MSTAGWGYTGATGPEHWGRLDPSYRACANGPHQSPVDLGPARRRALAGLRFSYRTSTFALHNNGHTVAAEATPGSTVAVDGVSYGLVEFHYHAPSEHRIGGRCFALELHLVNESARGELLVLGVLIRSGRANPALDPLIAALPARPGERVVLSGLDPLSLLPDGGRGLRYSYAGSLTTPPCSEGVRWHVFAGDLELSPAQIRGFTRIYEDNNRPLQALNGRAIALGSGAQAA